MVVQFVPDLYVKRWCLAYTFFINIFVYQNFENYLSDKIANKTVESIE